MNSHRQMFRLTHNVFYPKFSLKTVDSKVIKIKMINEIIKFQRLSTAAAVARHLPGGGSFRHQIILTNGSALGNLNSAIILRHPPMESAKPELFGDPPPPYDGVPGQLQPTAPPAYDDLLPGSIPSGSLQLHEPPSRLHPHVLPQKR